MILGILSASIWRKELWEQTIVPFEHEQKLGHPLTDCTKTNERTISTGNIKRVDNIIIQVRLSKIKEIHFFLISFFPNVDIKCVPYRFAVSQKFIVEREEPYYFNIWIKVILQCLKKKSYLKKYLLPKLTDLLNMPRIFYAK